MLSSPEMRDNYDYLLDHPYEFPMHFMRFSRAKYVPKTDLRMVLIFTVLILSTIQYFFLKSKYGVGYTLTLVTEDDCGIASGLGSGA